MTRRETLLRIAYGHLWPSHIHGGNIPDSGTTRRVADALEQHEQNVVMRCAEIARGLVDAGVTGEEVERAILGEFYLAPSGSGPVAISPSGENAGISGNDREVSAEVENDRKSNKGKGKV